MSMASFKSSRSSNRSSIKSTGNRPSSEGGDVGDGAAPCVKLVDSTGFDLVVAIIVLVNVALLSVETDTPGSRAVWQRINEAFLLIYLLELVMRFLRHGSNALRDRLTVIDIVLVVFAFIDRIASERSLARALPVLRLARVYRLLQTMPYFRDARELHVLVVNSSRAVATVLWVLLVLCTLLWSCAIWVKVAIGESPAWIGSMDPRVQHEPFSSFDTHQYFGSVPRSMLTLLQVTTLAQWADHVARPVMRVYPATSLFFLSFLFVVVYGLLMCIVSIIVQDAITASRRVTTAMQEAVRQEREAIGQLAVKIFVMLDRDGDAGLSIEELQEALETTDLERILKDLDVPVLDANSLLYLFDRDGDGDVNQEEFVTGIVAMNDDLQPRDFVKLSTWVWSLKMRAEALQGKLDRLQKQLLALKQKLEIGFTAIDRFLSSYQTTGLRHRAVLAVRNAGPDLPLATAEELAARALEDKREPPPRGDGFLQLQMPSSPAWAAVFARKPEVKTLWATTAAPFVTMRDRPHLAANHIAALRPGDLVEFEDLDDGPVRPEHLPEHPYLRCWKLGRGGERGARGFVVPYTASRGAHFAPSADASASRLLPEAGEASEARDDASEAREEAPEAGVLMAPVTVATPPRLPSPESEDRALATLVNRKAVLPPAPLPFHSSRMEVIDAERQANEFRVQVLQQNPKMSQLKELLS